MVSRVQLVVRGQGSVEDGCPGCLKFGDPCVTSGQLQMTLYDEAGPTGLKLGGDARPEGRPDCEAGFNDDPTESVCSGAIRQGRKALSVPFRTSVMWRVVIRNLRSDHGNDRFSPQYRGDDVALSARRIAHRQWNVAEPSQLEDPVVAVGCPGPSQAVAAGETREVRLTEPTVWTLTSPRPMTAPMTTQSISA
ncbi:hypothetical protein RER_50410 [Rhodococcus erythropolis PR4]|uniref:Uncharacterized protein n=1 Tax=Rhodococcus erythropolis (strain PR4 / NBRC 100887) TaxID=234621 RepID=C0ZQI1_RHOE4|nr:hypothetical protein RER_50410 [Rhodococcus erythropolis PR4]